MNMNAKKLVSLINKSSSEYPDIIFSRISANYTFVNPYSYVILRNYPEIIDNIDGLFVDGISMCWWIKLFCGIKVPRLSFDMTTVAKDFFKILSIKGESVFFIGAKEEEIAQTIKLIQQEFPSLNIKGFRNGYFRDNVERKISLDSIVKINPNYVVIGMGTPIQEQYMIDLKNAGFSGTIFTCGGFLHQSVSGMNYYPDWINKYNLRGFYRQFKEKGVFQRNYQTFIQFPFLFLYDLIKSKYFIK